MARSRRRKLPSGPVEVEIAALSPAGHGLAQVDDKPVVIPGALPGERLAFVYTRRQRRQDEGKVHSLYHASPQRVAPRCQQFGICGGCALQHLQPDAQLEEKQRVLLEAFSTTGQVQPERLLSPLRAESVWGYRSKARLGVKYVPKKGRVLVGFRERGSGFVTATESCPILEPKVGELITPLAEMIDRLSIRDKLPQIEVAVGEGACVLIFRLLAEPSEDDLVRLGAFADRWNVHAYLQTGGPETIRPLTGRAAHLSYSLPAYGLKIDFRPDDFTQINHGLNRKMVDLALSLLQPATSDRILDLFCGLGNFTLPLARKAQQLVGVEGSPELVAQARHNAEANGIDNVSYHSTDLYQPLEAEPWLQQRFDKALLDPPRSGAQQVIAQLPALGVTRIVYVSCYPDTLARDAGELVNKFGYRLQAAGVMDMFPHTAHVESIALFTAGD